MILTYEQWLADCECPELIDAFNGGYHADIFITKEDDGEEE